LRAFGPVSITAVGAIEEIQRAWIDWFGQAVQTSTRVSQDLFRCTTLPQMAEVQRGYWTESLKSWMDGSARVLQATQRASADALRPIEQRASETQHDRGRQRGDGRRNDAA
jgi:hypothetical protein